VSKRVIIYGSGDDLIEIDGAISEEFMSYDADGDLRFDDDTVVHVAYDEEGIWRVRLVSRGPGVSDEHYRATSDEGRRDVAEFEGVSAYSDALVLTGGFTKAAWEPS